MRLKEMRTAARLTQKQVAERIGVVQSAVARWENRHSNPRLSKLPKIAEAYGCTVADLLDSDSGGKEKTSTAVGTEEDNEATGTEETEVRPVLYRTVAVQP